MRNQHPTISALPNRALERSQMRYTEAEPICDDKLLRHQMVHARIDPRLKKSAERIFTKIGISTTEAIRLFLKQVELHNGLPFPVSIPNKETVAAMMEAKDANSLKRYRSFRELREQV